MLFLAESSQIKSFGYCYYLYAGPKWFYEAALHKIKILSYVTTLHTTLVSLHVVTNDPNDFSQSLLTFINTDTKRKKL